ncbi:MAG: ABC transporter permease [Spirochaetales bacterium]|nr:ABC transporter permease [Spirochaetales bacterium]
MNRGFFVRTLREYWGVLATLILINIFFAVISPYYFTPYNLINIMDHSAITMILAIGMVLVIATGGIDLSTGATLSFVGIITAILFKASIPIFLVLIIGLGIGGLIGAANGLIISKFRLQPFIVTLAMLSIIHGLSLVLSGGHPIIGLPGIFINIFSGHRIIRNSIFIGLIVFLLGAFIVNKTRYGLYIRSIGGNEECAYLCGIKIKRIKVATYCIQGLLVALGSFIFMSIMDAAEPNAGMQTVWMEAIAAPIIGGNNLNGGKTNILGAVIGVLILSSVRIGLNILGIQPWYHQLFIGLIIIVAVIANTIGHKKIEQM